MDQIPEGEVHAAARYLEYLAEHGDPFIRKLMNAPIDDEPVTPEEEEAVGEAWEAVKAGDVYTLEEVEKDVGL